MKHIVAIIIGVSVGLGIYQIFNQSSQAKQDSISVEAAAEVVVHTTEETYTVADGDTFTSAMEQLGFSYSEALEIVAAAENIFDFTSIRLGKTFTKVYIDDIAQELRYEPNSEQVVIVNLIEPGFETRLDDIDFDIAIKKASVTITNSMYASGLDAGLPETLILKMADIFAWEIDFATQTQAGDSFEVLYEERSRNGEVAGVGDILKATFTNVGNTAYAYRFINTEGDALYYDEQGNSLVRAFLKAPMSYSRITSGYTTNRFHPTLQKNMPHRAIDYAAPIGTPVMAVGDGTITVARWNGCYGNYIDVRHNGVYETQYAHLSQLLVTPGQHVKQGDVIGYSGTTGCSTGPHLHYQVRVNGELVNPLEVEFPAGDSISEEQRAQFEQQKQEIESQW